MIPTPKTPVVEPEQANPDDDADFAEEAGPKETEFRDAKIAKAILSDGFDLIP
jgi:hypothetical protein